MFRLSMIPLAAFSLALAAQTVPPRPEQLTYKPLTYQAPVAKEHKVVLKNGIPVYLVPDATSGVIRLGVSIKGGSFLEPKGKEGLAALCGQQWRSGGTLRTKAEDLDEQLDFLAASIVTTSGQTSTSVRMQILDKDLQEGMRLLKEVMLEPAFAQERLDLAKKSSRQQLESRNDAVQAIVGYQMGPVLFGEDHYMGRAMTASSLESITREDLLAFHQRLLHPANMVVSVSGRFDRKAMLGLLNETLGSLKAGRGAEKTPSVPAPSQVAKPGVYVCDKDVPQTMITMALPGLRRTDPDWFPCLVMNEILGGSTQAARLMKKLRSDEGLTYGVYSRFDQGSYYKGNWMLQIQTKNRSVPYASRLIQEQFSRIQNEPVSDEDLKVVKGILVDGFPNQFENAFGVASMFASEALLGWPEGYYTTFREKVQLVTKEDIQRVARKYLDPEKLVVIMAGKRSEILEGDAKDHPGKLQEAFKVPVLDLPLRDPLTFKPKV